MQTFLFFFSKQQSRKQKSEFHFCFFLLYQIIDLNKTSKYFYVFYKFFEFAFKKKRKQDITHRFISIHNQFSLKRLRTLSFDYTIKVNSKKKNNDRNQKESR